MNSTLHPETDHQRANAQRQREDIKRRVQEAPEAIRAEIADNLRQGRVAYPRRLSLAEVLRRAGGVDKNTLKQPYHETLRVEVAAFLKEVGVQPVSKVTSNTPPSVPYSLDHYAQMLVAAQIVRDKALEKAKALEKDLQDRKVRIEELEAEITRWRERVGNVVPLGR